MQKVSAEQGGVVYLLLVRAGDEWGAAEQPVKLFGTYQPMPQAVALMCGFNTVSIYRRPPMFAFVPRCMLRLGITYSNIASIRPPAPPIAGDTEMNEEVKEVK